MKTSRHPLALLTLYSCLTTLACTDAAEGDEGLEGEPEASTSGEGESGDASGPSPTPPSGSTGGGMDETGDETGDGSSGGSGEPDDEVSFGNTPEGCSTGPTFIYPFLPEEALHVGATTLTPPSYPFEVTDVTYTLRRDVPFSCVTHLSHRVDVFASNTNQPVPQPSIDGLDFQSHQIPAIPEVADTFRIVSVPLDPPIVLTEGQHLIVGVETATDEDQTTALCQTACDIGTLAGVDWWSNSASEPYPWVDNPVTFGHGLNFNTRAVGRPL